MNEIDRRDLILGGTALVGVVAVPQAAGGADAGLAPATDLLASVRRFTSMLDADKRKAMYLTLQENLQQDSPFVFMFQNVAQTALRSNVSGFISGPSFDQVFYRDMVKN